VVFCCGAPIMLCVGVGLGLCLWVGVVYCPSQQYRSTLHFLGLACCVKVQRVGASQSHFS